MIVKKFKQFLNESTELSSKITIEEFVSKLRFPPSEQKTIAEWWKKNRNNIGIHFFPFETKEPICGSFIDENTVVVNSAVRVPAEILLFITLHESHHADQHKEGRFEDGYFKSVADGNKELFLKTYKELEKEANDYAFSAMKELGITNIISVAGGMLRGNEKEGESVYNMMSKDIVKFQAKTFKELIMNQIL